MLPSLREVIDSLSGRSNKLFPNNQKGIGFQWFGLRQADYSKRCSCVGTEGTSEDPTCSRCLSTGYLFTDYLVKGFFWMGILGSEFNASPGILSTQQKNLVLEHKRTVSKFDFVLQLDHKTSDNTLVQPFRINRYFRVQDSVPIRGDDSRIEFWKCTVEERNIKDGRPGIGGTGFEYQGNGSNIEPE